MGKIVFGGIAPHPPIMIPEIGKGEEAKIASSLEAMDKLAISLREAGPELLVVISPHGTVFSDGVAISGAQRHKGTMSRFGAPQVSLAYENDLEFVNSLVHTARAAGIVSVAMDEEMAGEYGVSLALDHGVVVPMYFLDRAGINIPLVMVSMAMLPPIELYRFGLVLQETVRAFDKKVAVLASADLSHRLTPDAPAGYAPEGEVLDAEIVRAVRINDFESLVNLDPALAEKGGECGWRSIVMMLGSLDGYEMQTKVLSYEGPFGVGYMVATMLPLKETAEKRLLEKMKLSRASKVTSIRKGESEYVRLARQTLESYVVNGEKQEPPNPLPENLRQKAGVFVSIKKHGQLRGCIGTIQPTTDNLAKEIINNAISAGTGDPRFSPVEPEELDDLIYSVDVLMPPEPAADQSHLDPRRYGVIVRSGRKKGLLLPNLEGIDTVEEQVAIARQKAGIGPNEPLELERFEVVRYY